MSILTTRRIAALSAGLLSAPSPAAADVTAGVYLSVVYERTATGWGFALGWGAEAAVNHNFEVEDDAPCAPRTGLFAMGPLLRFGFVGFGDARLSLGGIATRRDLDQPGFMQSVEAGVSLWATGFEQPAGSAKGLVKPYVGIRASLGDWESLARWTFLLDEAELGVMPLIERRLSTEGATCIIGRPIRDARGAAWSPTAIEHAPDAVVARWQQVAEMERDAVPAFLQLARELAALGAPARLVRRALRSAADERVHTRLCAAMASRLGGHAWRTAPARVTPTRPVLRGDAALIRLATESWLDGCLGEGGAAAEACLAARRAQDPAAARVNRRIARDEARHAHLAWSVLAWALRRGGAAVADAVRAARDVALEPGSLVPVGRSGARWGVLQADARRARQARAAQQARARLDRLLAG